MLIPVVIVVVAILALMSKETAPGGGAITEAQRREFVRALLPVAQIIYQDYLIPPNVSVGKWAHETGYGTGRIYRNSFNLGSITAENWCFRDAAGAWQPRAGYEGRVYINDTIEFVKKLGLGQVPTGKTRGELIEVIERRPFRKYASALEGARDWAKMLATSRAFPERYAAAKTGDLGQFGAALAKTGYATDPDYADKVAAYGNVLNYA